MDSNDTKSIQLAFSGALDVALDKLVMGNYARADSNGKAFLVYAASFLMEELIRTPHPIPPAPQLAAGSAPCQDPPSAWHPTPDS